MIALIESDQCTIPFAERQGPETQETPETNEDGDAEATMAPIEQFGAPKSEPGSWRRVCAHRRPEGSKDMLHS